MIKAKDIDMKRYVGGIKRMTHKINSISVDNEGVTSPKKFI
jgi:hypothetical protein